MMKLIMMMKMMIIIKCICGAHQRLCKINFSVSRQLKKTLSHAENCASASGSGSGSIDVALKNVAFNWVFLRLSFERQFNFEERVNSLGSIKSGKQTCSKLGYFKALVGQW